MIKSPQALIFLISYSSRSDPGSYPRGATKSLQNKTIKWRKWLTLKALVKHEHSPSEAAELRGLQGRSTSPGPVPEAGTGSTSRVETPSLGPPSYNLQNGAFRRPAASVCSENFPKCESGCGQTPFPSVTACQRRVWILRLSQHRGYLSFSTTVANKSIRDVSSLHFVVIHTTSPFCRFWLAPSIQQQTDASAKWMLIPPQLTLINVTLTTFI